MFLQRASAYTCGTRGQCVDPLFTERAIARLSFSLFESEKCLNFHYPLCRTRGQVSLY